MKRVIHWFRRDLRVTDNTALSEAARRAEVVVPVFILEDAFRTGPDVGAARLAFLLESLESLRKNLAELGYPLIIRSGKSEEVLPKLCAEVGAQAVFANKRYEPYAQARDARVFNQLNSAGFGFEYQGPLLSKLLAQQFHAQPEQIEHAMALTSPIQVASQSQGYAKPFIILLIELHHSQNVVGHGY